MEHDSSNQNDESSARRRYLEAQFVYEAAASAANKNRGLHGGMFEENEAEIAAIVSGKETAYARAVEEFANATLRYITDHRPHLLSYRLPNQFCLSDLGKIRVWTHIQKETVLDVFYESKLPHARDEADVIDFGKELLRDLSGAKLVA